MENKKVSTRTVKNENLKQTVRIQIDVSLQQFEEVRQLMEDLVIPDNKSFFLRGKKLLETIRDADKKGGSCRIHLPDGDVYRILLI